MRVLITAATAAEWGPASLQINSAYTSGQGAINVSFHHTGVGMLASAVGLMQLIQVHKPSLVVQAGIAGCFDVNTALGTVVAIKSEALADTGVEEGGVWKDVFDLNLAKPDAPPYTNRKLGNPYFDACNLLTLPAVNSITINEITTRPGRIAQWVEKYNPFIESMEGAALHYVCNTLHLPFIQIRAVSNYIGERDKAKWNFKDSIGNLNQTLLAYVDALQAGGIRL